MFWVQLAIGIAQVTHRPTVTFTKAPPTHKSGIQGPPVSNRTRTARRWNFNSGGRGGSGGAAGSPGAPGF